MCYGSTVQTTLRSAPAWFRQQPLLDFQRTRITLVTRSISGCWDDRCVPPHLALQLFFFIRRRKKRGRKDWAWAGRRAVPCHLQALLVCGSGWGLPDHLTRPWLSPWTPCPQVPCPHRAHVPPSNILCSRSDCAGKSSGRLLQLHKVASMSPEQGVPPCSPAFFPSLKR